MSAIHPEISSIIRKRDAIHHHLYVEYRPLSALEQMVGLLNEIREEHRDEEAVTKIKQQYHRITGMQSRTARGQHGHKMRTVYWGYLTKINAILWDKGYLLEQTYRGITPAETLKKEKATPEDKPFPERLSEDIK